MLEEFLSQLNQAASDNPTLVEALSNVSLAKVKPKDDEYKLKITFNLDDPELIEHMYFQYGFDLESFPESLKTVLQDVKIADVTCRFDNQNRAQSRIATISTLFPKLEVLNLKNETPTILPERIFNKICDKIPSLCNITYPEGTIPSFSFEQVSAIENKTIPDLSKLGIKAKFEFNEENRSDFFKIENLTTE